jgi:acetyltransferase-like isoleucine patch superfamily enzyme
MGFPTGKIKLLLLCVVAVLPSFLKRPCYRFFFGYKIGKRVRIGMTLLDANECVLSNDVTIGHFNIFIGIKSLSIGEHARIGHFNIFRGGSEIKLGHYSEVLRFNEINSIPDPIVVNQVDPKFILGDGSIITTSHKIDFTDRVEIGKRVILGGRNSSLWTHNRQRTKPISIGDYSYIGSEIRIAPGGSIPARCVVGIGSVITKDLQEEETLIAGVPAKSIKKLDEDAKFLIEYKTRPDLPDLL